MRMMLATLLLAATVADAQVGESVTVAVTNVDVVVTNSKGERVRGLTPKDFEVSEAGEAREITNFSEIHDVGRASARPEAEAGRAEARPTSAPPTSDRPTSRIMILVDNSTLTLANRKMFVAAARQFIEQNMRAGDQVMIMSAVQSLVPNLGWTRDMTAVQRALDEIEREVNVGSREMERRRVEEQIRDAISTDRIAATRQRSSMNTFDTLVGIVRNYASMSLHQAKQTLSSFNGALQYFPRTPERKILLIAGEGVPLHPGEDMWHYLESARMQAESGLMPSGITQGAKKAMPLLESHDYDLGREIRAMTSTAFRRGIVIYPLNPGQNEDLDVENTSPRDKSAQFAKVAANLASYQLLARDTGGVAFIGARPNIALNYIARDLASYYSLGFRSSAAKEPGNIVVKSKQGYRVRLILSDAVSSPEEIVTDAVLAHHIAKPDANDMHIALLADPPVADGERKKVTLKVMIPVKSLKLVREGGEVTGGFNVYISTGDANGAASDVNKQTHAIRWPADALPHLIEKSVTFAVDVVLEPGRNQISVGVMDQQSAQTGYERVSI
ncbi:MAG TPA: VWA domain-containing protein [Thermoanaerobaculia bacterium]|nr:VWA domain-containing protein [Thermoanaerobaculia bacterium]